MTELLTACAAILIISIFATQIGWALACGVMALLLVFVIGIVIVVMEIFGRFAAWVRRGTNWMVR